MANPIAGKSYGTVSAEERKKMTGLEFVQGRVAGARFLSRRSGVSRSY
jgi:hypothetical protein